MACHRLSLLIWWGFNTTHFSSLTCYVCNSKSSQMEETGTQWSRMATSSSNQQSAVFRVITRWNNHQFWEQSPKTSIFLNFSLFDRSQLCSRDCVGLVWFRVSHDCSEIKIAQLMEITQPMKQLSQTLVHHLKVRNVKASIRSRTCFQNKSCSTSRRSCCHGLTDSNILQSFSTSRLQCKHNFSSW